MLTTLFKIMDHPRSRGVYEYRFNAAVPGAGSSPLARGLRTVRGSQEQNTGIIPARAGFTKSLVVRIAWQPDHPRSRGVYLETEGKNFLTHGSSPLARGLPNVTKANVTETGIIPARAGFTQ